MQAVFLFLADIPILSRLFRKTRDGKAVQLRDFNPGENIGIVVKCAAMPFVHHFRMPACRRKKSHCAHDSYDSNRICNLLLIKFQMHDILTYTFNAFLSVRSSGGNQREKLF